MTLNRGEVATVTLMVTFFLLLFYVIYLTANGAI